MCIACFAILNTNAIDKIKIFDTLNFGCEARTDKTVNAMQQHLYSDSTRIGQSYPLLIIMAFTVVLIMAIYGVAVARTATREIGKINYKPNS